MQLYVQQACSEQRRFYIYYLETDEKVNQQLLDNQMNRTLLYFKPNFSFCPSHLLIVSEFRGTLPWPVWSTAGSWLVNWYKRAYYDIPFKCMIIRNSTQRNNSSEAQAHTVAFSRQIRAYGTINGAGIYSNRDVQGTVSKASSVRTHWVAKKKKNSYRIFYSVFWWETQSLSVEYGLPLLLTGDIKTRWLRNPGAPEQSRWPVLGGEGWGWIFRWTDLLL